MLSVDFNTIAELPYGLWDISQRADAKGAH